MIFKLEFEIYIILIKIKSKRTHFPILIELMRSDYIILRNSQVYMWLDHLHRKNNTNISTDRQWNDIRHQNDIFVWSNVKTKSHQIKIEIPKKNY